MVTMGLRRWGAWALVADGLVWVTYGLLTRAFAPSYSGATRFVDYVAVALYSGGLLVLAIGVAAMHARQAGQAGRFERVAFLVAFAGAALAGVGDLAEDGLRIAAAVWAFFGGMLLLTAGLLLFGIASLAARVLPAPCGVLLVLSLVVGHPLGGLWSNWGGTVLFGLVWIVLACLLILNTPRPLTSVAVHHEHVAGAHPLSHPLRED
jgi:hypothetical protein